MKKFPSIPRIANTPDGFFDEGHLWLFEKVDGANFRFQLQPSGYLRFGDRSRVYKDPKAVPEPYQHAVRYVQETLDRDVLRDAVDAVEAFVFFGEAMHRHTIDYDWDHTPSFLGFDVWSAEGDVFLPPAAVEDWFERVGFQTVNAFERGLPAHVFDPAEYTVPQSDWYSGPAEGVVIRNDRGQRAKLLHPDFQEVDDTVPLDAPAEALAAKYATRHRFDKLIAKFEDRGESVTFDRLYQHTLEDIIREEYKQLFHAEDSVDMRALRAEVAALTRDYLNTRVEVDRP